MYVGWNAEENGSEESVARKSTLMNVVLQAIQEGLNTAIIQLPEPCCIFPKIRLHIAQNRSEENLTTLASM